jgi:hypothetical protein
VIIGLLRSLCQPAERSEMASAPQDEVRSVRLNLSKSEPSRALFGCLRKMYAATSSMR